MPMRIRWGVPGSYKTSKAIEWLIAELKTGRGIITNVRGLTKERVCEAYGIVSDSPFYNLDDEPIGIWLGMWQWAPDGYYFLLDEAQLLFPKNLRDIKQAIPDGFQTRLERGDTEKYTDYFHYWTKHRHANHDVDLTCPNIADVNQQLKGTLEKAYWQTNQATRLGFWGKGKCWEVEHDPKLSPMTKANRLKTQTFTIDKRLFACYESTATGVYKDTTAVSAAYLTPKFIFMIVLVLIIGSYLYFGSNHHIVHIAQHGLGGYLEQSKYNNNTSPSPAPVPSPVPAPSSPSPSQPQPQPQLPPPPPPSPYKDLVLPPDLLFCGYAVVSGKRYYSLQGIKSALVKSVYTANDVDAMGYKVVYLSPTMLILSKDDKKIAYNCTLHLERYNYKTGVSVASSGESGFMGQVSDTMGDSMINQQDTKKK